MNRDLVYKLAGQHSFLISSILYHRHSQFIYFKLQNMWELL